MLPFLPTADYRESSWVSQESSGVRAANPLKQKKHQVFFAVENPVDVFAELRK
jgi:hypothetical protein